MSINDLQRTAMLRAAHEADQTAILLRAPDTPRSLDPRATATTGYQLPSACWAPVRPRAPAMAVAPAAAALHRSPGVYSATTGFQPPSAAWAPARRNLLQNLLNAADNAANNAAEDMTPIPINRQVFCLA
jgi:hypothetical protein